VTLVVVLGIVAVFDVVVWLFGADSRPGFSDGRTDVKENWFPH
jgi:hypothetical protein